MSDEHMHDAKTTINHLRETAWRRALTPAEEEHLRLWLESHPEEQVDWASEKALTAALHRLPAAPVASNFAARVMAEIDREERNHPAASRRFGWLRWLPRVAVAGVVVAAGLISVQHFQSHRQAEYIESVTVVSAVGSIPPAQILEDFDAIRALNQAPLADQDLLTLLQ